jgi:transposase
MEKRAMSLSRRKFTKEFKRAAVRRLEMGASLAEVARACEVNPNVLHRWRREFRDGVDRAFPGLGKRKVEESRTAELERKIGQQTLEIDFLKSVLQRVEEARMLQALNSTAPSTQKSTKKPNGKRI